MEDMSTRRLRAISLEHLNLSFAVRSWLGSSTTTRILVQLLWAIWGCLMFRHYSSVWRVWQPKQLFQQTTLDGAFAAEAAYAGTSTHHLFLTWHVPGTGTHLAVGPFEHGQLPLPIKEVVRQALCQSREPAGNKGVVVEACGVWCSELEFLGFRGLGG